jgi:hypothetical protein
MAGRSDRTEQYNISAELFRMIQVVVGMLAKPFRGIQGRSRRGLQWNNDRLRQWDPSGK